MSFLRPPHSAMAGQRNRLLRGPHRQHLADAVVASMRLSKLIMYLSRV
jgi:hypothetical protein